GAHSHASCGAASVPPGSDVARVLVRPAVLSSYLLALLVHCRCTLTRGLPSVALFAKRLQVPGGVVVTWTYVIHLVRREVAAATGSEVVLAAVSLSHEILPSNLVPVVWETPPTI